jgi:hypothetical protein
LYGCETWSLTLREEHRLRRVFENRVLRQKRDGVTGGWRKLHNEELDELCSSQNRMRGENEIGRACSTHGRKGICTVFWWESQNERDQ